MDQIHDHFLKILASYLLRFHRIGCLWESKGEGSKNFLPEPDSSKNFWQLGRQVATLFPPLSIGLKKYGLKKIGRHFEIQKDIYGPQKYYEINRKEFKL